MEAEGNDCVGGQPVAGTTIDDVIIMTLVPKSVKADVHDSSPTIYWTDQSGEQEFGGFSERLAPAGVFDLVGKKKSNVFLSVLDTGKNRYFADRISEEQLSWLALQAASSFGTLPSSAADVVIIPAGDDAGLAIADRLVSLGASILYTNAEHFREFPLAIPFDSFVPSAELSEEDWRPADALEHHAGDFSYIGEIPQSALHDFSSAELASINAINSFALGFEFDISLPWNEDLLAFLSFGRETPGIGSTQKINMNLFYSIPLTLRRALPGYGYFHGAAIRADAVFNLWRVGNGLYDRETGDGFKGYSDTSWSRGTKSRNRESWLRKAEECGIKSLVDAYYDGIPYEDIASGAQGSFEALLREHSNFVPPSWYDFLC